MACRKLELELFWPHCVSILILISLVSIKGSLLQGKGTAAMHWWGGRLMWWSSLFISAPAFMPGLLGSMEHFYCLLAPIAAFLFYPFLKLLLLLQRCGTFWGDPFLGCGCVSDVLYWNRKPIPFFIVHENFRFTEMKPSSVLLLVPPHFLAALVHETCSLCGGGVKCGRWWSIHERWSPFLCLQPAGFANRVAEKWLFSAFSKVFECLKSTGGNLEHFFCPFDFFFSRVGSSLEMCGSEASLE